MKKRLDFQQYSVKLDFNEANKFYFLTQSKGGFMNINDMLLLKRLNNKINQLTTKFADGYITKDEAVELKKLENRFRRLSKKHNVNCL